MAAGKGESDLGVTWRIDDIVLGVDADAFAHAFAGKSGISGGSDVAHGAFQRTVQRHRECLCFLLGSRCFALLGLCGIILCFDLLPEEEGDQGRDSHR